MPYPPPPPPPPESRDVTGKTRPADPPYRSIDDYSSLPIHNELLDKLNIALRKRADDMVEQALAPVMQQASAPITKAIGTIIGGNNGAALAAVQLHVGDAINAIARDVKEHAYQALMRRAIHHLSTGQDFSLD